MFRSTQGARRPRRCVLTRAAVLMIIPVLVAQPARAQLWIGADAALATRYVWRGLVRVSRPVVQPSAYAALSVGSGYVTAGGWWNVEIERAGVTDLTLVGAGARGVGEADVWLEYATRTDAFDWALGFWHYRVHQRAASGASSGTVSTSELFASASTIHRPITVSLSAWLDVDRVRGAYYEAEVSRALGTHPLGEVVGSLFLGGRFGLSHGQACEADAPADTCHFRRDGIVFYELFAQLAFELPIERVPLVVNIAPRYELARDAAARRSTVDAGGRERTRFFWIETSLSWRMQLARPVSR